MAHVRLLRHYIHTPLILTIAAEALVTFAAAYTGYATRYFVFPMFDDFFKFAVVFTIVLTLSNSFMGVHKARLLEGYLGMFLRGGVAFFFIGTLVVAALIYIFPTLYPSRDVLFIATFEAFVFVTAVRWPAYALINDKVLRKRVVVMGTGQRALTVAARMRRSSDRRAFVLVGYLHYPDSPDLVSEYGGNLIPAARGRLNEICEMHAVQEIVVAVDNRRSDEPGYQTPFRELMDVKLSGVEVCEIQDFVEREVGKLDTDLLRRSWLVFSEGFTTNLFRAGTKRIFDIFVAVALAIVFVPVMLLTALTIKLTEGWRAKLLYQQTRVGLNGRLFQVYKFRTMVEGAEESGAVWADHNDPRTTTIGNVLRKTHLDEVPQLYNVIVGDMSMVGPRPERPVFVDHLKKELTFYDERHRVKPGVTGWAQLYYPYGASIADAKEKLQYDLYYLKNHSFLLDIIIILQTVETIIVGEGAR
ncbi:MAG: TIGR03013 family XrtA/PEP-CTERM system glycosyltransferase [Pseudomonadota bacterium]|nr:TIGR03013 family XrtA/PEP-CTERM system glycosyltransferase [Pseudomonadota bacterium]